MAIYKQSGGDTIAKSGKVGGTVYAVGGSAGPFIRVWAHPRNRRTSFQTAVRGVLSGISSSWRTLSATLIEAWQQAASGDSTMALRKNAFGDTRKVSGFQLFQRVNNLNLEAGFVTTNTPPLNGSTDAIISAVPNFLKTGQVGEIDITTFAGAAAVPANTKLLFYATSQKSAGRSFFGSSQYRFINSYAAAVAINPLDVATEYIAKFGALVQGARIGLKVEFLFYDAVNNVWARGGAVYATATVGA